MIETLEQLYERELPTMSARIWTTCSWAHRMGAAWKIGDHRYLVISMTPEAETVLYVQFWSEPLEPVLFEVCSGESSPASLKYVQKPQRDLLESLGFAIGGRARNFGKEVEIANAAAAEEVAREVLRILFDGFGYRGQWPLEFQSHRGERARRLPVHLSLTPEDVAKLLSEHGCKVAVTRDEDGPVVLLQHGRRRLTAKLAGCVPDNNLYTAIILDAFTRRPVTVSDEALARLNGRLPGVFVRRHEGGRARISMLLRLDGGVTDAWIVRAVDYFVRAARRCERLLRPATSRNTQATRSRQRSLVH